jgi:hypothetical protein
MSDQERFDTRLAALFEQEHRHIPADAFVAEMMRKIRAGRRRREITRQGLRISALAALVAASPWLIAGVEWLNAAVEASLDWVEGPPVTWVLGAAVLVAVMATRLRRR